MTLACGYDMVELSTTRPTRAAGPRSRKCTLAYYRQPTAGAT
jgi:hypothetical protein